MGPDRALADVIDVHALLPGDRGSDRLSPLSLRHQFAPIADEPRQPVVIARLEGEDVDQEVLEADVLADPGDPAIPLGDVLQPADREPPAGQPECDLGQVAAVLEAPSRSYRPGDALSAAQIAEAAGIRPNYPIQRW